MERVKDCMFEGFPEETVRFFLDIRFHNENSFFKAHEDDYQSFVKEPFYDFIEALAPAVQTIADDIELRPSKCLARIRRDTRFTKDKSPFRDHMWFLLRRSGEPRDTAVAYWFELSPEVLEWGVGFWGYNRPAMDALRRRMVNKPREVLSVLKKCGIPDDTLMLYGDRYKRMPPPDTMHKELQRLYPCKEIYVKRVGTPVSACYSGELVALVAKDLIRLKPLYELLRAAADEGMAQLDA
ncbi:MAG: DUF2461 domain-containing protein [Clostridia bacterium]